PEGEVARLAIRPVRVDGFAPPIDRDLDQGPEVPDDILSPVEWDRHVTVNAAVLQQRHGPRWEREIEGLDADAAEPREGWADQEGRQDETYHKVTARRWGRRRRTLRS